MQTNNIVKYAQIRHTNSLYSRISQFLTRNTQYIDYNTILA